MADLRDGVVGRGYFRSFLIVWLCFAVAVYVLSLFFIPYGGQSLVLILLMSVVAFPSGTFLVPLLGVMLSALVHPLLHLGADPSWIRSVLINFVTWLDYVLFGLGQWVLLRWVVGGISRMKR